MTKLLIVVSSRETAVFELSASSPVLRTQYIPCLAPLDIPTSSRCKAPCAAREPWHPARARAAGDPRL